MGVPWFKIEKFARQHGVLAFSSNYELYGDLSNRFITVLGRFSPQVEQYSIDEAFLELRGIPTHNLTGCGRAMQHEVRRCVGLPVTVGIGSTKTRAKFASHLAKKQADRRGVCDLEAIPPDDLEGLMRSAGVADILGVASRLRRRLEVLGIKTVLDLAHADPTAIRKRFSVVLERTVRELQGTACLDLELVVPKNKEIMSSRTFGKAVETEAALCEAIGYHVNTAGVKLRKQGSVAKVVRVFIGTDRFRDGQPQYFRRRTVVVSEPTDDSIALTRAALTGLAAIYRPGYGYRKAGVMLSELCAKGTEELVLFVDEEAREKRGRLMSVLDRVNEDWGRGTLGLGTTGLLGARDWSMRRSMKSPSYTTRWDELAVVRAR